MRLKIAAKISLGFGIITIAVIINAWITSNALERSRNINERITSIYTPSQTFIADLYSRINDSRMLVKSWVFIDKISDTPDKIKLRDLHTQDYKAVMDTLKQLSNLWDSASFRSSLFHIDSIIVDSLFPKHKYIMEQLNSFEKYDDPFVIFEVTPMTEEGGDVMMLTNRILSQLMISEKNRKLLLNRGVQEMIATFNRFQNWIFIMGFILVVGAIVIGLLTINSLAIPINHTKNILLSMGKGILPKEKLTEGNDELGQMAKALNMLVKGLTNIFNFSLEIGKGNFDTHFSPLSEEDVLGHSLLDMRNELKKAAEEEARRKKRMNSVTGLHRVLPSSVTS